MPKSPKDEEYDEAETKRRAEQALRGGFVTPPTPLKDKSPAKKRPKK